MHLEGSVLGKPRPTVCALKRLCACVRPLMQQQGCFGAEGLSTLRTDVSQIAFMYLRNGRSKTGMIKARKTTDKSIRGEQNECTISISFSEFQYKKNSRILTCL